MFIDTMVIVGGLFCFTAIVGWALMTLVAAEMTVGQTSGWFPRTFVGRFVRWSLRRPSPGLKLWLHAGVLVGILAGFGGLITGVSWVFGILPLALTVVELLEISKEFEVIRLVK